LIVKVKYFSFDCADEKCFHAQEYLNFVLFLENIIKKSEYKFFKKLLLLPKSLICYHYKGFISKPYYHKSV